MPFIYRCLAVSDVKKAIKTRCNEHPDKNGILCKKHLTESSKNPIHILMHHEVTKHYGIPYKGQLTVTVDLRSKSMDKPITKSTSDEIVRITKNNLIEQMNAMDMDKIKGIYDDMGLKSWKQTSNKFKDYAFKYYVCKEIVEKIYSESISK